MTEKRFTTDNGSNEDVCLVDNLTKKEYESNFNDIVDLMNKNWEQTQRFEKHNQYLEKENEQLKQDKFICLDCEHSGYTEIGCLCKKKDHWIDYKTECEDYEELK